mgnify:FL=1
MKTKDSLELFTYSIFFATGFMSLSYAIATVVHSVQTQVNLTPLLRDFAIVFVAVATFRWSYSQARSKGRLPKILVPVVLLFDFPNMKKSSSVIKLCRLGLAILKTTTNIILLASVFANALNIWVAGLSLAVGTFLYTFADAAIVCGEQKKVTQ